MNLLHAVHLHSWRLGVSNDEGLCDKSFLFSPECSPGVFHLFFPLLHFCLSINIVKTVLKIMITLVANVILILFVSENSPELEYEEYEEVRSTRLF